MEDYDLFLDYDMAKKIVDVFGWRKFVSFVDHYFLYGLFSCTDGWYENPTCGAKLKGGKSDVTIGWKGIHD